MRFTLRDPGNGFIRLDSRGRLVWRWYSRHCDGQDWHETILAKPDESIAAEEIHEIYQDFAARHPERA